MNNKEIEEAIEDFGSRLRGGDLGKISVEIIKKPDSPTARVSYWTGKNMEILLDHPFKHVPEKAKRTDCQRILGVLIYRALKEKKVELWNMMLSVEEEYLEVKDV